MQMKKGVVSYLIFPTAVLFVFTVWFFQNNFYSLIPIPIFLFLVFGEYLYNHRSGTFREGLTKLVTNISIGGLFRVIIFLNPLFFLPIYYWLYDSFRIFELPVGAVGVALAFILYDLFFYISHRLAHNVSFLWATHAVHHQSEVFDLSVGFRQGPFQPILYYFIFFALPFIGVHPLHFLIAATMFQLYNFLVHSSFTDPLGILNYVFVTPSEHEVHHTSVLPHESHNFGGVFTIWDRVFGSFQPNSGALTEFGIDTQNESPNPVISIFNPWKTLFRKTKDARSLKEVMHIWFGKPHTDNVKQHSYEFSLPVIFLFFIVLLGVYFYITFGWVLPMYQKVLVSMLFILLMYLLGRQAPRPSIPLSTEE